MVYIALFSIIIGGAVIASYQIFESSGQSETRAMIQEEGGFIIGKINWTLSGAQAVTAPTLPLTQACTESNTLAVIKWDTGMGVILIDMLSGNIQMKRGGNPAVILNNSNVSINNLQFTHCKSGSGEQESIKANLTLTAKTPSGRDLSQDFSTTQYLRK